MRRANSPLVQRLQHKYASQDRSASSASFDVKVMSEVRPGKWRAVETKKMTLAEIKAFKGRDGDHEFDGDSLIISDDYVEPTQQLKLNYKQLIATLISGR